jgi:cell division protein FtsB
MNEKNINTIKTKFGKVFGYAAWGLIIIFSVSIFKNINRVMNIKKQVEVERQKVEKIKAENESLQAQIDEAQSQDFIEKQMRDKLGLTKEGEVVVILPDEEIVKNLAPSLTSIGSTLPDPNWVKWKKLFF